MVGRDNLSVVSSSSKRPARYEDLLALPEGMVGQIIDGELIATPRPATDHALVSSALGAELLSAFARGPSPAWWILDEPELHFAADVLVPDLAGWRRERVPSLPRAPFLTVSPDWVCEILSPSTAGIDRVRKLRIYARESIAHAWIIDPVGRSLEVFRRQGANWLLTATFGGDERARAEPFEALEVELAPLWLPER